MCLKHRHLIIRNIQVNKFEARWTHGLSWIGNLPSIHAHTKKGTQKWEKQAISKKISHERKSTLWVDEGLQLRWAHSFELKKCTLPGCIHLGWSSAPYLSTLLHVKDMHPVQLHAWANLLHEGALLENRNCLNSFLTDSPCDDKCHSCMNQFFMLSCLNEFS